jgi:PAS domain-containing protein
VAGRPLFHAAPRLPGVILFRQREAEERARAEEALHLIEERLRIALERLQDAISTDMVGVLFLNLSGSGFAFSKS